MRFADCPAQVWGVPPAVMSANPLTLLAPLLRAQSTSDGETGVERAESCIPSWAQPETARINPRNRAAGFIRRRAFQRRQRLNARRGLRFPRRATCGGAALLKRERRPSCRRL